MSSSMRSLLPLRVTRKSALVLACALAIKAGAASANGPYAYIPSNVGNTVSEVDLSNTNLTPATITVVGAASNPGFYGVALSAGDGALYVSDNINGVVFKIDTATGATLNHYNVGTNPRGIAVDPRGKHAFVANSSSTGVSIVDTTTGTIADVDFSTLSGSSPSPYGVALNLAGTRAFVTDTSVGHRLCRINALSPPTSVSDSDCVAVGENESAQPTGVALSPDGTLAYVVIHGHGSSVSVVDTGSLTVLREVPLGSASPNNIVISASGKRAYVGTAFGSIVVLDLTRILELGQDPVVATVIDDSIGSLQGLAMSADGTRLLAVDYSNSQLHFIDVVDDANTRVASVTVNQGPYALGQFTRGDAIFVSGFQGG